MTLPTNNSFIHTAMSDSNDQQGLKAVNLKRCHKNTIRNPCLTCCSTINWSPYQLGIYTLRTKYFRAHFLVLQIVTNRGLYSVPGRTK